VYVPELDTYLTLYSHENVSQGKVKIIIRPESIELLSPTTPPDYNRLRGKIEITMFLGDKIEARVRIGKTGLIAYFPNDVEVQPGREVDIAISPDRMVAIPV
jgi:iron(III) transport system ATP-binding protein